MCRLLTGLDSCLRFAFGFGPPHPSWRIATRPGACARIFLSVPKGTASPLACFCLSPTGQSSTHRHVYASCPRHLPRRRLAPAGRSIFEAFLVPTTAPDLQHTPELRHLLTGPFYTSVAVMRASAPRLWCCCRCWPLPMATKQVLAATSRARLPPARPAAGVGTPTHSRTHPRLRFYGRASGAGMAVVSLQSLELPSSPATVPSDYAPPRAWRSSPPPRGMLVSGSATYREVQPLLPLRELLGPPGCTDSSAERGFSHGFFLSEFDAFVVHASDCVFHKTSVLCGLLSPSLVVCRVVHLHLLHNITHG